MDPDMDGISAPADAKRAGIHKAHRFGNARSTLAICLPHEIVAGHDPGADRASVLFEPNRNIAGITYHRPPTALRKAHRAGPALTILKTDLHRHRPIAHT